MKKQAHELVSLSEALKAIAHPDRISILLLLAKKNGAKLSVTQICEGLKLNQPEVSRHLSILKAKGILLFERAGSNIYYFLNRSNSVFKCVEKLLQDK